MLISFSLRNVVSRITSDQVPLRFSTSSTQGGYEKRFPTLAELACEGMWWAVRNLVRRYKASEAEYSEVFHGKTAAQWALHHGLAKLSSELEYYVSGRHDLNSRSSKISVLCRKRPHRASTRSTNSRVLL
jgi:hypothetical protein